MNCKPNVHSALVYDIGSATIHAGFAGDLNPALLTPSIASYTATGEYCFDESRLYSQTGTPSHAKIIGDEYEISDPRLLSTFLRHSHQVMAIPEGFSTLYSQPAHLAGEHNRAWQRILSEISFESDMGISAMSIISDAILAAYAHCAQTALVVDFGWSCIRVVPVIEGRVRVEAIKVHPIGGYALERTLHRQLENRRILPKSTPGSVDLLQRRTLLDMLSSCVSYAENTIDEDFLYFLNERPVDVQFEMKLMTTIHFNELNIEAVGERVPSLPMLIKESISECPDDAKRQLWANIVTSGGFSSNGSFISRLQTEMEKVADPIFKVHVQFPMAEQSGGRHTVWVGGSITASSQVFDSFCVTKEEWSEHGESCLRKYF